MARTEFVNAKTRYPTRQEIKRNDTKKIENKSKKEINKMVKEETKDIVKGMKIEEKKVISEEKEKKKKPKVKNSEIINQVSKLILKDILNENEKEQKEIEITGSGISIE